MNAEYFSKRIEAECRKPIGERCPDLIKFSTDQMTIFKNAQVKARSQHSTGKIYIIVHYVLY